MIKYIYTSCAIIVARQGTLLRFPTPYPEDPLQREMDPRSRLPFSPFSPNPVDRNNLGLKNALWPVQFNFQRAALSNQLPLRKGARSIAVRYPLGLNNGALSVTKLWWIVRNSLQLHNVMWLNGKTRADTPKKFQTYGVYYLEQTIVISCSDWL